MQIFKSILGRKTRFLALFLEIVIVTVIGWLIIEPVALETTRLLSSPGYDYDRLVMLTFSSYDKKSSKYDATSESEDKRKDYAHLLHLIRERPGVEKATYSFWMSFEMTGRSNNMIRVDSIFKDYGIEDIETHMTDIRFLPNSDFFSTYGIKDANGKPFQEPENDGRSYIISNTTAKALFPNSSPIGYNLFEESEWYPSSKIVGVTSDLTYKKGDGRVAIYFEPVAYNEWFFPAGITLRLGEGVNPRKFIEKLKTDLSEFQSGNSYLTHPVYMSDQRATRFANQKRVLTQKWIILAFFMINVLLGVAGTFYVQCKTRIPDAGVMRAFGASKWVIRRNIIGEALLTAFLVWLIGSALYMIYLSTQGFPMDTDAEPVIRALRPIWHDTKLGRYSIIGGILLLLLLATSALGAYLPARRVGRVPIVDSLRDE